MENNMYDGLWTIEFTTPMDWGCGVLVFNGTQVMGGDCGYYYSGQINITGNLSGEFNVVRFNPNIASVFGDIDSFKLLIKDGTINNTSFTANATVKGMEHLSINITGKKKVDKNESD